MRKYETVFISDPDIPEKVQNELFAKIKNIITRENGIILSFDEWGTRKLAYEIKKKLRGFYTCITYGGTGSLVTELERNMRLSDDVMKFMTILLSDNVTAEQLEQEAREIQEARASAPAVPPEAEADDSDDDDDDAAADDDEETDADSDEDDPDDEN